MSQAEMGASHALIAGDCARLQLASAIVRSKHLHAFLSTGNAEMGSDSCRSRHYLGGVPVNVAISFSMSMYL